MEEYIYSNSSDSSDSLDSSIINDYINEPNENYNSSLGYIISETYNTLNGAQKKIKLLL